MVDDTDTVNEEPPPPGEEISVNLGTVEIKKSPKVSTVGEEKRSSDEMKHSKKSRDKKKHKKEIRSRKKKKRDRKEKKSSLSRSNTPEMEINSAISEEKNNEKQADSDLEQSLKETIGKVKIKHYFLFN